MTNSAPGHRSCFWAESDCPHKSNNGTSNREAEASESIQSSHLSVACDSTTTPFANIALIAMHAVIVPCRNAQTLKYRTFATLANIFSIRIRARARSAATIAPTVFPQEINAAQMAGSWKVTAFVRKDPRKMLGQISGPIESAAYMANPAGTHNGAGHIW